LIFAQFTAKPLLAQATEKERDIDWAQIVKAGFNKDIKNIRDEVMRSVPLQGLTDLLIERLAGKSVDAPRKGRAKAAGDKALSLLLLGATSDATPFLDWIKARLKDKKADPEITFKDFHQKFNADKGQQLSLVATDIKDQEVLILNHRTTPDLPVAWGVRMSMNIPFVWSEVVWQAAWKQYRGKDKTGNPIVDGGVLANFPLRYLLEPRHSEEVGVLGSPPKFEGKDQPARVLGMFLDSTRPVTVMDDPAPRWNDLLPAARTAERLLDTMMDTWDLETLRQHFDDEGRARETTTVTIKDKRALCRIGTKGYSALEFDMDQARVDELVDRGRCGMDEFLKAK
jgi:predicted acylesterase/phospholipase RssA